MIRKLQMNGVDCANCASKMEYAVSKLDGVNSCSVNFLTQKMTLDHEEDIHSLLPKINDAVKKIDRGAEVSGYRA